MSGLFSFLRNLDGISFIAPHPPTYPPTYTHPHTHKHTHKHIHIFLYIICYLSACCLLSVVGLRHTCTLYIKEEERYCDQYCLNISAFVSANIFHPLSSLCVPRQIHIKINLLIYSPLHFPDSNTSSCPVSVNIFQPSFSNLPQNFQFSLSLETITFLVDRNLRKSRCSVFFS